MEDPAGLAQGDEDLLGTGKGQGQVALRGLWSTGARVLPARGAPRGHWGRPPCPPARHGAGPQGCLRRAVARAPVETLVFIQTAFTMVSMTSPSDTPCV